MTKQAIFDQVAELTDYEVIEAAYELDVIDEGEADLYEPEKLRDYVREAIEEAQAMQAWEARISY